MIVPDINLLVYAYNADAPHHARARLWWEESLSGTQTVGLSWVVCLGFLRLMTNRRVLRHPWEAGKILAAVRSWLDRPQVQLLHPGVRHMDILDGFARQGLLSSDLATDAHLAALAIEHQAVLCSNDADFERYPGLKRSNPVKA
jgi:hypothetical protein